MAKQLLSQELRAVFPRLEVEVTESDMFGNIYAEQEVVEEALLKNFDSVKLEYTLEEIRPDIIAYSKEGQVLIEIAVTHFTDNKKKRKIRSLGLPAIEVDLSKISYAIDTNELRRLVIEETRNKKWLSNPKVIDVKEKLRAKLDQKIGILKNAKLLKESVGKSKIVASEREQFVKPDKKANRWFVCERCDSIFNAYPKDVAVNLDEIRCPKCDQKVSTKPALE